MGKLEAISSVFEAHFEQTKTLDKSQEDMFQSSKARVEARKKQQNTQINKRDKRAERKHFLINESGVLYFSHGHWIPVLSSGTDEQGRSMCSLTSRSPLGLGAFVLSRVSLRGCCSSRCVSRAKSNTCAGQNRHGLSSHLTCGPARHCAHT